METTITKVNNQIGLIFGKSRRSTPQDLAFAEWHDLWDQDLETGTLEDRFNGVKGSVELYRSDHCYGLAGLEIPLQCCQEMSRVDAYIDEDIEGFNLRDVHRYETAMRVVDKQVTAQSPSGVVIYAASPVGDVSHDESLRAWAEAS